MKLTCVIINRNNFRARIFNQIQIPARETSRSLGSRLRRSPLAIRDRLVGKSNFRAMIEHSDDCYVEKRLFWRIFNVILLNYLKEISQFF